jgi:hypothetical protein
MSTHNLRKYLDLLNEADPVPPNATTAPAQQENRCVKCGTPKDQHAELKHAFAAGSAAGGGGITRIKKLQQELLAAGAALGATGAGRDGIDGDLGPLTRAAAEEFPEIAAKYQDVLGTESATPAPTSTPAAAQASMSKLISALDTIEKVLTKYKVKMSESRSADRPHGAENQMATWRNLMEAEPTAQQRRAYQDAIQRKIPPDTVKSAETPGFAQSKIQKGGYVPPAPPAPSAPANPYVTRPGGSKEAQAYQAQKTAQTASGATTATTATTAPAQATPTTQAAEKAAKGFLRGAVGRALPGVGAVLGAKDAYDRARMGDYTGAGIAGAAGLVSLVPGLGWVAGLGLNAVNLARDVANDPKINISPEDAAVLDQNLKDIQTLSKDPAVAAAITPEIRARLERVIKAAASVIVADTPAAGKQSATPAGTGGAPDDLVKSVDGIEKILTKYQFEDIELDHDINVMTESDLRSFVLGKMHLLSESEQMAVRRDLMVEAPLLSTAKKVWDGTKWLADKAYKATIAATVAGAAYTGYQLVNMYKEFKGNVEELGQDITNDKVGQLSAADLAELEQHATVLEKYLKTPEDAAKLPPELQQRLAAINTRMRNMVAAGVAR